MSGPEHLPSVVVPRAERYAHRTARTTVTVTDAAGRPLPGCEVAVAQRAHEFVFGDIGFDLVPLANDEATVVPHVFGGATHHLERLAELYLDLFNAATLPFYWRTFEPVRGRPDTARLLRAARWFAERGVAVKGHPLVWHTLAPAWLLDESDDDVREEIRARIVRDVTDFAGVIDAWDAINESVILPVFAAEPNAVTRLARRDGRLSMIALAFETARAANPHARLTLNDFDMSEDYLHVVEEALAAGVRIDALGLQSHMHQGYWGEEKTLRVLDRFRGLGLPLHLTETTLLSGDLMPADVVDLNDHQVEHWPSTPAGEERQADEIVRHYSTLFADPAVEAVTYWGLSDDGAWLRAPSGLVRADATPKPAYEALRGLVKGDWWLDGARTRTDDEGRFVLDGFRGRYEVRAGGDAAEIHLAAGAGAVRATLGTA